MGPFTNHIGDYQYLKHDKNQNDFTRETQSHLCDIDLQTKATIHKINKEQYLLTGTYGVLLQNSP